MAITTGYLFDTVGLRTLIEKRQTPTSSKKQTKCYPSNSKIDVTKTPFYATLGLVTMVKQGTSRKQRDNEKQEVTTVYNATYSVHIIGKGAIMWASRLDASLRLTDSTIELYNLGIGILTISPIRDLSLSIDGGYEERAQIDITLSQRTTLLSDHSSMQSVDFILESENDTIN